MRLALSIGFADFAPPLSTRRPPAGCSRSAGESIHLNLVGELFDGELGEFVALRGRLVRVDSNGDGKITLAEFLRDADHFFLRLDRDGNQAIDSDEMRIGDQPVPRTEPLPSPQPVATAEADLSQLINNDEFILPARSPVPARNSNHDGLPTPAELESHAS